MSRRSFIRFRLWHMLVLVGLAGLGMLAVKSYLANADSDKLNQLVVVGGFGWDWELDERGRVVSLSYTRKRYGPTCTWEISKLSKLKRLSVGSDTRLSLFSIESLSSMSQLEYLDLGSTTLTSDQVELFRTNNPACKVLWKKQEER